MKKINIGLLGLGAVGSGVVQIIENNYQKIALKTGQQIVIKKALVHDLSLFENYRDKYLLTTNVDEIINDESINIVIEVMGGVDHTFEIIKRAFENGKSVISANKDLIAMHGEKLTQIAKEYNCDFYYEASVAGGIPILSTINHGLSVEKITKITGILNGTTNYILTQMTNSNLEYEEALELAKQKGFAEADPSSDIDGLDSGRKIVILARLAHSMNVNLKDVYIKGICNITKSDIELAKKINHTIKLIGQIRLVQNDKLILTVEPVFINNSHLFASIDNEFNGIIINGEATNELVFTGPGAGSLPTANSILSDLITVIENKINNTTGKHLILTKLDSNVLPHDSISSKYIINLKLLDVVGSFSRLAQIFANNNLSFDQITQVTADEKNYKNVIITIDQSSKSNVENVIKLLNDIDFVDVYCYYPILNL